MKYYFDAFLSKAYWQHMFSRAGAKSALFFYGLFYLFVESLDFFGMHTRDQYGSYTFLYLLLVSVVLTIFLWRPIKSILIPLPKRDCIIEVRIGELFEAGCAIMISTNTKYESDVAGGKIALDSLQGQFVARYFPGNQNELLAQIETELSQVGGDSPFPIGTTIPVVAHGKTFYLTAMADLNEQGNASTTLDNINRALDGLWKHVKEAGELQGLAVPVIGTGRGRMQLSRKKLIAIIAESFMKASERNKITDRLVIVIRPEDASKFKVNLYSIKDHLNHVLHT